LTKPFRYLVIGLIINFGILFIAGSYLLLAIVLSYKGRCGIFWFFGEDQPCPLVEYIREEFGFILLLTVFELVDPACISSNSGHRSFDRSSAK